MLIFVLCSFISCGLNVLPIYFLQCNAENLVPDDRNRDFSSELLVFFSCSLFSSVQYFYREFHSHISRFFSFATSSKRGKFRKSSLLKRLDERII